jgi:5-methylcytosine-specific restriction endonuclease McrA
MFPAANPTQDLTGRRFGWWYVEAYACQRDGINFWQCICCCARPWAIEKVVAETTILDRKANTLKRSCACREPQVDLVDRVFGLWTVTARAGHLADGPGDNSRRYWQCRCTCGRERVLCEPDITSGESVSCGCRTKEDVNRELSSKRWIAYQRLLKSSSDRSRRKRDSKWTPEMERALRDFQPARVVCGVTADLTTDHVRALSSGHGLEPGNAVRLCRACNSFKNRRGLGELPNEMASRLQIAARSFKEFWGGERTALKDQEAPTTAGWPPPVPDPVLIGLLRAVEAGDCTAIPALAEWLEDRGDPRATSIRKVTSVQTILQSNEMWRRLGLTGDDANALRQYFGLGPPGAMSARQARKALRLQESATSCVDSAPVLPGDALPGGISVQAIASRERVRVQTARNRIIQAVLRLTIPSPGAGRRW